LESTFSSNTDRIGSACPGSKTDIIEFFYSILIAEFIVCLTGQRGPTQQPTKLEPTALAEQQFW